jgi:hypothetical protein
MRIVSFKYVSDVPELACYQTKVKHQLVLGPHPSLPMENLKQIGIGRLVHCCFLIHVSQP